MLCRERLRGCLFPLASHLAPGVIVGIGAILSVAAAAASEVRLKNGTLIEGTPVPIKGLTERLVLQNRGPTDIYPVLMIDDGMRRYFVGRLQVEEIGHAAELARYQTFELPQKKSSRRIGPVALGTVKALTPFDRFGRRTVSVLTQRGEEPIVQGVTRISPKYLTVEGITHHWQHGVAVTSVPPDALDAMLRTATKPNNPDDRMAISRFYLQAGMYPQASAELESIVRDFPELKERSEELNRELRQLVAKQVLVEVRRRRAAGQHRLAWQAAKQFPVAKMSAEVLREVSELIRQYDQAREQAAQVTMLLGELQAQLTDETQAAAVTPMRSILSDELDYESLPRLDAFLKLSVDDSLSADEKLALAYSGWVLGSAHANTDLDLTIRLWNARFLTLEYLRSVDSLRQNEILSQLNQLEGVGPSQFVQLIPHLPPVIETPSVRPGEAAAVEVAGRDERAPIRYHVVLPPEYTPHHRYPLVVTLAPVGTPADQQLQWWAGTAKSPGQSGRRGYIVIAPEYIDRKAGEYDYSAAAHETVVESIRDARKRFSVDSDRVFLSGHGSGGDAAFDIGMSHPDLFAGVIPVMGISDKFCMWYWQNARHVPFYVVNGELARQSLERNARDVSRMMSKGFDVVYCEYVGRGFESFYAEVHRLFDWMDLHRRVRNPKEIEMKVLRPSDDRFYWVEAAGFPKNVVHSTVAVDGPSRGGARPMTLDLKVTPGNTIYLRSGADKHTLRLSPEVVDFEKRLAVRFRGRQRFNDFVRFDLQALLEDLRQRGDRQKLVWAKVEI